MVVFHCDLSSSCDGHWSIASCLSDRAKDTRTGEIVALKKMRMENEKDGL